MLIFLAINMFEKANWLNFKSELINLSQEAATTLNIDELLVFITSKINIAITNNIPLSNHSDNPRSPLPSHILRKIKARNRLQRIYRKNITQINRDNYYKTQEEIKDNIKSFNSNKWRKFTEKIGNNPLSTKSYWRRINRIMKKKQSNFFPNLLVNDKIIEDDEDKAIIFGEKLYTTFNQQPEDINTLSEKHKEYVDNFIILSR